MQITLQVVGEKLIGREQTFTSDSLRIVKLQINNRNKLYFQNIFPNNIISLKTTKENNFIINITKSNLKKILN